MARNSPKGINRGPGSSQLVSEQSLFDQQWKARMSRISFQLEENAKLLQELRNSKNPLRQKGADQDSPPNRILIVTIHTMIYPITEEVLHQVFSPYGFVEKIVIVSFQARIQFQSHQNAVEAMDSLQGRCIYDGCCRLAIQISNFSEEFQPAHNLEVADSSWENRDASGPWHGKHVIFSKVPLPDYRADLDERHGSAISKDLGQEILGSRPRNDCRILSLESREDKEISRSGAKESSKKGYDNNPISQNRGNADYNGEFRPSQSSISFKPMGSYPQQSSLIIAKGTLCCAQRKFRQHFGSTTRVRSQ